MKFIDELVKMRESIDLDSVYYPPPTSNPRLTREQYANEIRKISRAKKFRGNNHLPKQVYDYGWNIARIKGQEWISERVLFWLYAYDRGHKWTTKDFDYNVNERAYEIAKAKRKERREKAQKYALEKHNKPRPLPEIETSWEDCNGPPLDLIKEKFS